MGLIKMVTGSVGSTFRDAAKDYFRCDGMTKDVLVMPATQVKRDGSCNNAGHRVITDGSVFDVAAGQAALLIENGKVIDFVLASENAFAGQYTYNSQVEPSFLATEGFKNALKVGIETELASAPKILAASVPKIFCPAPVFKLFSRSICPAFIFCPDVPFLVRSEHVDVKSSLLL